MCDDYAKFYTAKQRRARKSHRCDECGGRIEPREVYCHAVAIYDGSASTIKTCAHCSAAISRLDEIFRAASDEPFCAVLGGFFDDAREQAQYVREKLRPGQYFRVLREIVAARKRRRAVNA